MSRSPTIRGAERGDIGTLAELSGALGYPADAEAISGRFETISASRSDVLLVAEDGGAVIGWLQAHSAWVLESGFRVEIVGLVIAPGARRAGAGRMLVEAAEQWARDLGATTIVVRSATHRTESHVFYQAIGYARKKTQEVYAKALVNPG
jgi:GNAT superfamily N-acetyltransferase